MGQGDPQRRSEADRVVARRPDVKHRRMSHGPQVALRDGGHDRIKETPKMSRPPLPPFTAETAAQKVRMAEDAWNTREPTRVALAYTPDGRWRNRAEFLQGRAESLSKLGL